MPWHASAAWVTNVDNDASRCLLIKMIHMQIDIVFPSAAGFNASEAAANASLVLQNNVDYTQFGPIRNLSMLDPSSGAACGDGYCSQAEAHQVDCPQDCELLNGCELGRAGERVRARFNTDRGPRERALDAHSVLVRSI